MQPLPRAWRPSTERIPPLGDELVTRAAERDGQRVRYTNGPPNVHRALAQHPGVFRAHRALSTEVREAAELPDRVRELLILRTAWRTQCEYEWAQHQAMAPAAGIGDHELRALTRELDASPWDEADRAVLAAADELCAFDCITESTWSALAARFDAPALVLLTFTVGVYRSLAGFLNSAGVPLDAGLSGWPE